MEIVDLKTTESSPAVVRYDHRLAVSSLAMSARSPIVRCPANLRAFEEAGEVDRIHAFGWLGPTDTWLDLYEFEPGNGSRYTLVYGKFSPSQYVLAWREHGTSDRWMLIAEPGYLHHTYVEEKFSANTADAVALLKFLDLMGHAVGYPKR